MAVTTIHPITATLKKAIDYIRNPEKTDGEVLVSSFCCAPETADIEFDLTRKFSRYKRKDEVLARHLIQSFAPGEVSPEQAHELGKKLAEEVLNGQYEYVIATHIDKGHIHNHIIFNNVNMVSHKRYRSNEYSYHQIQKISDRICRENGLSVIEDSTVKNRTHKEWQERKRGTSWKAAIQNDIDECIEAAKNFEDFYRLMEAKKYEVKFGKRLSFRPEGKERFAGARTLGEDYTEEAIRSRIAGTYHKKEKQIKATRQRPKPGYRPTILKINLLIDIKARAMARGRGYEQALKIRNLKETANMINFLSANGITQYSEIGKKVDELTRAFDDVGGEIKRAETMIKNYGQIVNAVEKYRYYTPMANRYQKAWNKKKYYADHESEFLIYEAAKRTLIEHGVTTIPELKNLKREYADLLKRKDGLYARYTDLRAQLANFKNTKANVDQLLKTPEHKKSFVRFKSQSL